MTKTSSPLSPPPSLHVKFNRFYDDFPCHATLQWLTAFGLDEVFIPLLFRFHDCVVMFPGDWRLFVFIFSAGWCEHPSLTVHFLSRTISFVWSVLFHGTIVYHVYRPNAAIRYICYESLFIFSQTAIVSISQHVVNRHISILRSLLKKPNLHRRLVWQNF